MFSLFAQLVFLLSSYPLARWVLPHIKTRKNSLILHISLGLVVCSLIFRIRIILALTMATIGYLLLDKNPYCTFVVTFFMNISIHLLQLYNPVHRKVNTLTKMIFFKIVATSFNLADGRSLKSKGKDFTPRQKNCYLTKKPTFYEWIAYCFTPFGANSPSFYEFRLFEYILDVGQNERKVSEKSQSKAISCIKQCFVHFIIYYSFRHYFNLSYYQSEFFLSLNIVFRILLVLFLGVIIYSRFFMLWKAVDAGLFEVGLFDIPNIEEEEFTSLSLLNLLSTSTIKDYGKAFNHTNSLFWSNYLTSRGPDSGLSPTAVKIISTIVKPTTKGLYGAYLLSPIEKKLYGVAEPFIEVIASHFTDNVYWAKYVFTQVFMIASKSSVRFKTIYAFYYVNYVIYFFFWIAALIIIIVGFVVKKIKKTKNEKEKKD